MAQRPLDGKNNMATGPWVFSLLLIHHKENSSEVSLLVLQQTQIAKKACCPWRKD